jgi:hypothetical protein
LPKIKTFFSNLSAVKRAAEGVVMELTRCLEHKLTHCHECLHSWTGHPWFRISDAALDEKDRNWIENAQGLETRLQNTQPSTLLSCVVLLRFAVGANMDSTDWHLCRRQDPGDGLAPSAPGRCPWPAGGFSCGE